MTRCALAVLLLLLAGHCRAAVNDTAAKDGESITSMTDMADELAGTENSSDGDELFVGLSPEERHAVEAGLEAQQWGIGGVLAMSGLVCLCGVVPLCCFFFCFFAAKDGVSGAGDGDGGRVCRRPSADQSMSQTICLRPPVVRPIRYDTEGYVPPENERVSLVRRALHGEMLLSMMQPFALAIMWLGVSTLFTDGKIPSWVQAVVVSLPMLRVCFVEASLTRLHPSGDGAVSVQSLLKEDLGEKSAFTKPFLLSKLDVADASSDGTAIAVVVLLERSDVVFRQRLLAAWGGGATGRVLAPAVLHCNLSGLMVGAQVGASLMQIGLSYGDPNRKVMADVAGMGRLAQRLTVHNSRANEQCAAWKHIGKVSFEGAPQLILQSSAVLAAGDGLLAQPELLASMAITSGLMLKKFKETVDAALNVSNWPCLITAFTVFVACSMPLCVLMVWLRLGAAEMCGGSHLFDVSSWRCVPAPLPHQ